MSHLLSMHSSGMKSIRMKGTISAMQIHHCFLTESEGFSVLTNIVITLSRSGLDLKVKRMLLS